MAAHQSHMEKLWEKLPKNKDGYTITYYESDVPYLYDKGFVDTQRFSLETWMKAFEPFKQKDGHYILNKEQFLKLDVFRFKGPALPPFDAFKLREGPWTNVELAYLWESSLKPSSSITFEIFEGCVETLKKQGKVDKFDQLLIDDEVKKQLAYLLDRFPSPRRKLEKEVNKLREQRGDAISKGQKNRDASQFVAGQTQSEAKQDKLKALETSAAKPEDVKIDPKEEELDVKSLRKPGKKFRG